MSVNKYDPQTGLLNPLAGVPQQALDAKQPKTLSAPIVVDGESKTTVETALDALASYTREYDSNRIGHIKELPLISYGTLPSQSTSTETYCREWIPYMQNQGYFNGAIDTVYLGVVNPNSTRVIIGHVYPGNATRYSAFMMIGFDEFVKFGFNNGTWYFQNM